MKLFEKDYSSEELCDLERDISECFDPAFNKKAALIPVDRYGFSSGTYKVTVEWFSDYHDNDPSKDPLLPEEFT